MTKAIRAYGEGLILEWLLEEYEPGHPNVERIYSEPLIEELIENDGVKNVDRVIALCMVMIYREELYQVKVSKSQEENK
nr:MAG TPA: Terminase large subunit [Caudoviricetes sp.]